MRGRSSRALIEDLLSEARPRALRQAERTYAHLPAELRARAVEQAFAALRDCPPADLNRRASSAALADALTASLREIHSGWCRDQARDVWGLEAARPATAAGHPIAGFVEAGLAGLERAVLQMEIGAGRDTPTARAALRLGPRAYRRHRDEGLQKLRGAVAGLLRGRVCDDHLDAVTLAATGDRIAAAHLSAGPGRCRACAREASTVRGVLHERLALAPWPLAIKPAGLAAAKLGAIGAIFGGKGSSAGGTIAGGWLTAKTATAVVAAAVLATGSVAAVEHEDAEDARPTVVAHQQESVRGEAVAGATVHASERRGASRPRRTTRRRQADRRTGHRRARSRVRGTSAAPATTATPVTPAPTVLPGTVRATRKVVDGARRTVDETATRLPRVRLDASTALPDVRGTVDRVTGGVERLLAP